MMKIKYKQPHVAQYRVILEYNNGGHTATIWTWYESAKVYANRMLRTTPEIDQAIIYDWITKKAIETIKRQ